MAVMRRPGKRILAVDLGSRRIGLAVSDPLGIVAQALPTLVRTNRAKDLAALARLAAEHEVCRIVVGLPLRPDGVEGPEAAAARRFAREVARRTGLPVELHDERFTTMQAQRTLRTAGVKAQERVRVVDQLAAVLILQSYLDARSRPEGAGGSA